MCIEYETEALRQGQIEAILSTYWAEANSKKLGAGWDCRKWAQLKVKKVELAEVGGVHQSW